ncbi:hypothetical protein PFDSM3638_06690 [Pyrococcus furiosus DSM 3638]|uniref:Uncharacterized protein n=3 Tax=Pyrococcus furiosus TaxID=2261 RepID=Q8U184_PYRFU|nr:hypothetical protein [Pyrococcus furiosus]AAL81466.1 hypothetical protein PF1342 [Pyrococcus furiosus DSM 3638]AFN04122.1 hypothetical protein PFC_05925 [Pyrococcus furiosus COM1]QEK78977.1 hypothetical protein PFDSM3638_06690 [Pyrococcus furiosus DSM 3638]
MKGILPYVIFRSKKGTFALDAYLALRVEKVERIATLIRKAEVVKRAFDIPPNADLTLEELSEFLESSMEKIRKNAGESFDRRLKKIRRWNLARLFGIPTGHTRHIAEDEHLSREHRESLLALSILENVCRGGIEPIGYGVVDVEVKEGKVYINGKLDPVYTELIKIDMKAALALLEILSE